MHKRFFLFALLVILLTIPFALNAQIPFGGAITYTQPCNSGFLLYVIEPLKGLQTYMWFTGNLPYLMHVVPHPGQNLLGMAGPVMIPCILGKYQVGQGFPIIYHGSSI